MKEIAKLCRRRRRRQPAASVRWSAHFGTRAHEQSRSVGGGVPQLARSSQIKPCNQSGGCKVTRVDGHHPRQPWIG
jgi:hypothetical protein